VEETSLALGIGHLLDRPPASSPAASCSGSRSPPRSSRRPSLVLLDEPTSQLDPVAGDELIWQLRRLNQEADTAVLLIEHRLERCLAAADRVIAMADGAIVCDSDPRGFLEWAGESESALQTPGARMFEQAGLRPPPTGVKQARATLRTRGLLHGAPDDAQEPSSPLHRPATGAATTPAKRVTSRVGRLLGRRDAGAPAALSMRGVWHEIRDGPAILRGLDLQLRPGEPVVLMGRNGAGKSTLLRHAAGLLTPTRGKVERSGRVALLLQNPGDYFLHERVDAEADPAALEAVGLGGFGARHPRDLSGGQRQRLALAIVLGGQEPAAVLALDEPTRGMDRMAKRTLARRLSDRAAEGLAVVVATHDAEFAADFATRAVLLADGRVIADGPIEEILAGGWYFTTESARILDGAPGVLRPEHGAELLRARIADAAAAADAPHPALAERAVRP
jgi:energy-coupling factor transporter ATP-binding protein EcfA2